MSGFICGSACINNVINESAFKGITCSILFGIYIYMGPITSIVYEGIDIQLQPIVCSWMESHIIALTPMVSKLSLFSS